MHVRQQIKPHVVVLKAVRVLNLEECVQVQHWIISGLYVMLISQSALLSCTANVLVC